MKQVLAGFFMVLLIGGCTDNPPVPDEPPPPPPPTPPIVELGNPASPKKALVIGNSQYAVTQLDNPQNDATDMAKLLAEEMGFHVIRAVNLSYKEMKKVIADFHKLVANTPDVDEKMGLFYFSGHGARSNRDKNYLLPVDNGTIRDDYDLRQQAFQVKGDIVKPLETDNNGANIIIADACLDNPYEGSNNRGDNKRGLIGIPSSSPIPQKRGTIIAFAASEGEVADDGTQRNGLFTKQLLTKMKELKHAPIENVFGRLLIRSRRKATENKILGIASH